MISEDEAFWAGIAVATMMLGGGFSMIFLPNFTGFGSVVLALGLMTMAMTIQLRAKPMEQMESLAPIESRSLTPTVPIESQIPVFEQGSEEFVNLGSEASNEQESARATSDEHVEPTPLLPDELPETEPQSPPSPTTPPTQEKPKEQPQTTPPAN
jgi:hypothetical protein